MKSFFITLLGLFLSLPTNAGAEPTYVTSAPTKAYKYSKDQPRGYHGSGAELPEPKNLQEIRLGYFAPPNSNHATGGMAWMGASLALEEANQEGGYQQVPFRLLSRWSDSPWKGGVGKLTQMVYQDQVWAILGSLDSASTHLAEQVVAKARLPLLDPMSTDNTVNEAHVPWTFSCLPGDTEIAKTLTEDLQQQLGDKPFLLFSATDHSSRILTSTFLRMAKQQQLFPAVHREFNQEIPPPRNIAALLRKRKPKALVIFAPTKESAKLVRSVRELDQRILLYGGPSMRRHGFSQELGSLSNGIKVPRLIENTKRTESFIGRFSSTYGEPPDYTAMAYYDATQLMVAAIRQAGLNRARILAAIETLSGWIGVSGPIVWDPTGRNHRPVTITALENSSPE